MGTALILLGDMNLRQKVQTVRHLNTTIGFEEYTSHELSNILDKTMKISGLRNDIAHNNWVSGQRPGSIKPIKLKLRGDEPTPMGHWHNEKSWTAQDLETEARNLDDHVAELDSLLKRLGVFAAVQARIDETKENTSERDG